MNIKRRSIKEIAAGHASCASLKASKTASIKSAQKKSAPKAQKVKKVNPPKSEGSPDIIFADGSTLGKNKSKKEKTAAKTKTAAKKSEKKNSSKTSTEEKDKTKGLIIPALAVVLCLFVFVFASQAGWIDTFLTPSSRSVKTTEETTSEQETTTKQKETTTEKKTTTEKTTEETTTEETPSTYVIDVNLAYNQVIIYERGEKLFEGSDDSTYKDDYFDLIPLQVFSCSPGVDGATPTGTYYLGDRSDWCFMVGDVYTQYATRIDDAIMFHSIPYYSKDPGDIETYEYNILGYDASSGCIRLNVRDASWIFYNCEEGTEVNIYYDWSVYSPVEPNPTYQIPSDIPQLSGWDPTDTYYSTNPWLTYSPSLTNDNVSIPAGSSADYLIASFGPTDDYGNNLANYFYTDGGYDLYTAGTYYTNAHIDVGPISFSCPITITVTGVYYPESDYDWSSDEDSGYDWSDDSYDNNDYNWGYQEDTESYNYGWSYENDTESYNEDYNSSETESYNEDGWYVEE